MNRLNGLFDDHTEEMEIFRASIRKQIYETKPDVTISLPDITISETPIVINKSLEPDSIYKDTLRFLDLIEENYCNSPTQDLNV